MPRAAEGLSRSRPPATRPQVDEKDSEEVVIMQFGRVGDNDFTCDFQAPLSPLQAFGIALSSFDYKIACE